jgi:hypothetical protein
VVFIKCCFDLINAQKIKIFIADNEKMKNDHVGMFKVKKI